MSEHQQFFPRLILSRGISPNFISALSLHPPPVPVHLPTAEDQHARYLDTLLACSSDAQHIELPGDARYPDCVFIEDTCFAVRTADSAAVVVVARPGAVERRGETEAVAEALSALAHDAGSPSLTVMRVTEPATLDGGDVMLVGRQLFIGVGARTNAAAVAQAHALLAPRGIHVHGVHVPSTGDCLHLKSLCSPLDERTVVAVAGAAGDQIVREIQQASKKKKASLEFVRVPDAICANVLRIGRTVLFQEGSAESKAALEAAARARGLELQAVSMSENAKVDGALTCCSVLI